VVAVDQETEAQEEEQAVLEKLKLEITVVIQQVL
jgi:hypothetical protein